MRGDTRLVDGLIVYEGSIYDKSAYENIVSCRESSRPPQAEAVILMMTTIVIVIVVVVIVIVTDVVEIAWSSHPYCRIGRSVWRGLLIGCVSSVSPTGAAVVMMLGSWWPPCRSWPCWLRWLRVRNIVVLFRRVTAVDCCRHDNHSCTLLTEVLELGNTIRPTADKYITSVR